MTLSATVDSLCGECGGRDKSDESDVSLALSSGPFISLEPLSLAVELVHSFSLSTMTRWTGVVPLEAPVRALAINPLCASSQVLIHDCSFLFSCGT